MPVKPHRSGGTHEKKRKERERIRPHTNTIRFTAYKHSGAHVRIPLRAASGRDRQASGIQRHKKHTYTKIPRPRTTEPAIILSKRPRKRKTPLSLPFHVRGTARKKRSQPRWRSGHTHTHIISVCMCVTKLSGSAYTVCDNLPPFVTRPRRRRRRSPLSTTPFARCGLSHSKLPPAQRTSLQHWRIRSSSMLRRWPMLPE